MPEAIIKGNASLARIIFVKAVFNRKWDFDLKKKNHRKYISAENIDFSLEN